MVRSTLNRYSEESEIILDGIGAAWGFGGLVTPTEILIAHSEYVISEELLTQLVRMKVPKNWKAQLREVLLSSHYGFVDDPTRHDIVSFRSFRNAYSELRFKRPDDKPIGLARLIEGGRYAGEHTDLYDYLTRQPTGGRG